MEEEEEEGVSWEAEKEEEEWRMRGAVAQADRQLHCGGALYTYI